MKKLLLLILVCLGLASCDDDPKLSNAYIRKFEGKTLKTAIYDGSDSEPDRLTLIFDDGAVMVIKANGYLRTGEE